MQDCEYIYILMQLAKANVTLNNCYQEKDCVQILIQFVNLFIQPNENKN